MSKKSMKQLLNEEWEIASSKETKFYPKNKSYAFLPVISGCPNITAEKFRPYISRALFTRQPVLKIKKAPRFSHIRKIINYPWRRLGAPQVALKGNKGTGKSVLLNLFLAFFLARGVRAIMFDNSRFESRSIAPHGWFDKKGTFHPFVIDVWIPTGYEFKSGEEFSTNPLWDHRDNVHKREYSNLDQIISSTSPHKLTVIYDECFTPESKLLLFSDLLTYIAERARIDKNYLFVHHELASLVPETPNKDVYKLIQYVSAQVSNLRKDRIGVLTSFHLESEIFYRIVRKFSYICHKQPENKKQYTPVEEDSLKLAIDEVNIARAGFWMKHKIGYFPGLPDMYRLIPQRNKLIYPSMQFESTPSTEDNKTQIVDELDFLICQYRAQQLSWREVSSRVGLSLSATYDRGAKLGLTSKLL